MPIALTPQERSIVTMNITRLSNQFHGLRDNATRPALEIAALRMALSMNSVIGLTDALTNQARLGLCKLVHNHPQEASEIYVLRSLPDPLNDFFGQMIPQYTRQAVRDGYGNWSNRLESVMWGLCQQSMSSMYPIVVPVPYLRALIRTVSEQAEAAGQAVADISDVRARMAATADVTSSSARRENMVDGRGRCYQCAAVKPRRVQCRVCGYMPRTAG